jgi:hypothetical protein
MERRESVGAGRFLENGLFTGLVSAAEDAPVWRIAERRWHLEGS